MRMPRPTLSALVLFVATTFVQYASAQVSSSCNPLKSTCPADPAFGMEYLFNFNSTPSSNAWETTAGAVTYDPEHGATFTINKQGDSPTIQTNFYIFWGRTEVWLKCSPGQGIVSSVMMLSDDLDEIDIEFIGGNSTYASTNYFGKGHQDYHNAGIFNMDYNVQDDYHNYTTVWTNTSLDWYMDSTLVRTLSPSEANSSHYYPQTPMKISIGIWAGGDPSLPKGTIEWAGGVTNYTEGPFNMYVKSIHISDYSHAKEYTYGDMTGSWESIKLASGNSTVREALTAKKSETVAEKWEKLSPAAKVPVYACGAGAGAAIVGALAFYCMRQRRRGYKEARVAESSAEEERQALAAYRAAGHNPDGFSGEQSEYNSGEKTGRGITSDTGYSALANPTSPRSDHFGSLAEGAVGTAAGHTVPSGLSSPVHPLDREEKAPSPLNSPLRTPSPSLQHPQSHKPEQFL